MTRRVDTVFCKDCEYWWTSGEDSSGICRRFPPKEDEKGNTKWPKVNQMDWCGEHKTYKPT